MDNVHTRDIWIFFIILRIDRALDYVLETGEWGLHLFTTEKHRDMRSRKKITELGILIKVALLECNCWAKGLMCHWSWQCSDQGSWVWFDWRTIWKRLGDYLWTNIVIWGPKSRMEYHLNCCSWWNEDDKKNSQRSWRTLSPLFDNHLFLIFWSFSIRSFSFYLFLIFYFFSLSSFFFFFFPACSLILTGAYLLAFSIFPFLNQGQQPHRRNFQSRARMSVVSNAHVSM